MKPIHIFCASHAAITTMDSDNILHQPSSATGGRAIDRHNPIIQDQKRLITTTNLRPPPNNNNDVKKQKNTKTNNDQKRKTIGFADENKDEQLVTVVRRQGGVLLGWGCTRPGDFISPANSSRFLLADKALSDQFDPLLKQVPPPEKTHDSVNDKSVKSDGNLASSPVKTTPRSSSSLSSRSSDQQVVVLKVSLHCRGCERKMRKHISKMEGVTSFDIDFMAKKVTVVGNVTPLAVLTSVSKVKNAKLLTPTTISAAPVVSNFSEVKKQIGIVGGS